MLLLPFNIRSHVNNFILLRLQLCLAVFVLTDTAPMPNSHKLEEEYLEGLYSVACCLSAGKQSCKSVRLGGRVGLKGEGCTGAECRACSRTLSKWMNCENLFYKAQLR